MSKILCTFSGKYGDILWSLPTAKQLAALVGKGQVDFAVMPYYENLLPLLACQSYIDKAFVIRHWLRTHSNHGDQPWQPPCKTNSDGAIEVLASFGSRPPIEMDLNLKVIESAWLMQYDRAFHLTYKGHPGITAPAMPLIDFIAWQHGLRLPDRAPFIDVPDCSEQFSVIHLSSGRFTDVVKEKRLITYSFNEQYDQMKKEFFQHLWAQLKDEFEFFNTGSAKWVEAAWAIKNSLTYVGCRSANWVLAIGLGQSTIVYEPHPARHASGHLGKIFGYPGINEMALPFGLSPEQCALAAASVIREKYNKQKEQRVA
jgi:hypothetical protein